jgi:tetratricopeptide (TPR) repeat protein
VGPLPEKREKHEMMMVDGSSWLRLFAAGALTAGALLTSTVAARAADPDDVGCSDAHSARDPEAAKVAFRAGQTAFSEGAYARAAEFWNQAYRDDCTAHALLLNLAMAEELLGRPAEAIHRLKLFNRRSPESPYVEANAKRIQRLEQMASEMSPARGLRPRTAETPVPRPAPAGVSVPIVVSVAGGVVAVTGTALFVEGRLSAGSAGDRCGGARSSCAEPSAVIDGERARARAQTGGWLAVGGVAAAAGGLVWDFLSTPTEPLDQTAPRGLTLLTDMPQGAGVGWAGVF